MVSTSSIFDGAPDSSEGGVQSLDGRETLRQEVETRRRSADLSGRYWGELFQRYYERQRWAELFLAVAASSSVAAWGIWAEWQYIWKSLSALSTIIAVSLPILNWKKYITDLSELSRTWYQLRSDYEMLQIQIRVTGMPAEQILSEIKRFNEKENELNKLNITVPDDQRLLAKLEADIQQEEAD